MSRTGATTWIRRFHETSPGAPSLLCFPHAGGAASYYFRYSRALASPEPRRPPVDVSVVQYPGRHERHHEPALDTIDALACGVVTALTAERDPQSPIRSAPALFGHSMGAVVAFEVARRLERDHGVVPRHLFVSGRRAPSRASTEERVHTLDDRGLVGVLRALNGTDGLLLEDDELLRMILPAVRADYRAIETYRCAPGAVVGCPVTALVGDRDPVTSTDDAAAWREHTAAEFDLRVAPGGHFYLNAHVDWVTGVVGARLHGDWLPSVTKPVSTA
jgi:surfactin synthase thioesterase subunit